MDDPELRARLVKLEEDIIKNMRKIRNTKEWLYRYKDWKIIWYCI